MCCLKLKTSTIFIADRSHTHCVCGGGEGGEVGWRVGESEQYVTFGWLVLLLYVPSQQLRSLRDGQFT